MGKGIIESESVQGMGSVAEVREEYLSRWMDRRTAEHRMVNPEVVMSFITDREYLRCTMLVFDTTEDMDAHLGDLRKEFADGERIHEMEIA